MGLINPTKLKEPFIKEKARDNRGSRTTNIRYIKQFTNNRICRGNKRPSFIL